MKTLPLISLLVLTVSCATAGGRAPTAATSPRRVDAPTAVAPPATPEADPENVERRYGFAEARARREKAAAEGTAAVGHDHNHGPGQIDVVPGAVAGAGAAAGHAHDHAAAGATAAAAGPAKSGIHDHGAAGSPAAGCSHSCPCMMMMGADHAAPAQK